MPFSASKTLFVVRSRQKYARQSKVNETPTSQILHAFLSVNISHNGNIIDLYVRKLSNFRTIIKKLSIERNVNGVSQNTSVYNKQ